MKKGLAVIYDPHNVYQFLWYYCTYGKDIEWDALCLPNSFKGEYLSQLCKKLGLFKNVYRDTTPFDSIPLIKRFFIFIKMLFFALFGQQRAFSRSIINKYINNSDFDIAVVLTDVGFISGLFLTLAPEKEIIILEDGMGDYELRKYSNIFKRIRNLFEIQGFCLAILGYSNVGHYYPLRTTKNCIKYCSHPDKMLYRDYKEMKVLFDMEKTNITLFKKYLEVLYPEILDYFKEVADLIILTTSFCDYVSDEKPYINKIQSYVNNNYQGKKILIKKHPRDNAIYNFSSNIVVSEIPSSIPAEVLLPYIGNIEIIFCDHSSTNLYLMPYGYNPKFIYFSNLFEESKMHQSLCRYRKRQDFIDRLRFFGLQKSEIIDL